MKHFLLSLLLTPLAVWAQTDKVQQSPLAPDAASPRCKVVYPQHEAALRAMKLQARPLGEPSTLPSGESTVQIADNGKEYVYRLALCVSPYYTHQYYGGDKAKVREWVKEAGEYLNTVYQRDLGIRFEIVEDDRLILTDYPADYPESKFTNDYGTKIINALIGTEAYDCGILIRPTTSQVDGMAAFGGAYYTTDKGNAMCNTNFPIIAHELGHMFGAQHSHEMVGGQCVEPGKGESIMSYGENKQTFALASIIPIRRRLQTMPYYPDSKRDPNTIVGSASNLDNIPYVVASTRTKPVLNRKQIRKNYTVTKNTRFQFNIPVENAQSSFTYGAQNYDVGDWNYQTNALQPIYPLAANPNVMFQPYYNEGRNEDWEVDAVMVKYSDAFRPGRYQFLLAAADGPRYDVEPVYLHIVEGKAFELKTNLGLEQFQGKEINLTWEPCTELYGTDSRVRISLSDDFGQTFKYVLDDQVPNTGKWKGYWPYITINRTFYRNFSQGIRGGVVKIEVIGEAAYAVSKELPAMANPKIQYTGGFELIDRSSYVRFKSGPEPYIRLNQGDEVPAMTDLVAYHKNNAGQTQTVKGTEEREGNVIRRRWTATINGTTGTYTQLIVIDDPNEALRAEVNNQADDLKLMATDLHKHKGEPGYPLTTLPAMQKFDKAYTDVFNAEGNVLPEATTAQVDELRRVMEEITKVNDSEIVKPADRHYYTLRNYQDVYGRYDYYYLAPKANDYDDNGFTTQAAQATVWRCTATDNDTYAFADEKGENMNLEQLFSGCSNRLSLDRGTTWGAFTLVNDRKACGQLSQGGKYFSRNEYYVNDPVGYRVNRNGRLSTDFQFVPVDFVEARKSPGEQPWNILGSKQQLTLADTYSDLFVARALTVEQLNYTRDFADTEWQTLYLPFETNVSDWAQQCEVAVVDRVQLAATDGSATAEYAVLTEGKLQANQPYLIRAKAAGTVSLTLSNVRIQPTDESPVNLSTPGYTVSICGNYGVVTADKLTKAKGYALQGGELRKATATAAQLPSMRWYLSVMPQSGSTETLPERIVLVKKGEAPVATLAIATAEGYGTIYTESSYVMPQGVVGYAVTQADADRRELTLTEAYAGGETVPARTPLLVKGEKRSYLLFAPTPEAAEGKPAPTGNLLLGTATEAQTSAPNGQPADTYRFYKLYYADPDHTGTKQLGFYWGAPEGAPFVSQANKAYLALSAEAARHISGFVLPGDVTGIDTLPAPGAQPFVVYTLTGIRLYPSTLSDLPSGIYIVNGEKKVIK